MCVCVCVCVCACAADRQYDTSRLPTHDEAGDVKKTQRL